MQLRGWDTAVLGPPPPGSFVALFVHTDAEIVGKFNSSPSDPVLTGEGECVLTSTCSAHR